MTDRELMQQALEALESDELDMVPDNEGHMVFRKEAAITALRERLRQPSACDGCAICNSDDYVPISSDGRSVFIDGVGMVPLAFGHKPSAEPVYCGCGDQIVQDDDPKCGTCVSLLQKDEPSAEPVAYRYRYIDGWVECQPLYTSPPPRTPLTDAEINDEMDRLLLSPVEQEAFGAGVRYAERKHGIGDKK